MEVARENLFPAFKNTQQLELFCVNVWLNSNYDMIFIRLADNECIFRSASTREEKILFFTTKDKIVGSEIFMNEQFLSCKL